MTLIRCGNDGVCFIHFFASSYRRNAKVSEYFEKYFVLKKLFCFTLDISLIISERALICSQKIIKYVFNVCHAMFYITIST